MASKRGKPTVTVGQSGADIVGGDNRALQGAVDYIAGLGGGDRGNRPRDLHDAGLASPEKSCHNPGLRKAIGPAESRRRGKSTRPGRRLRRRADHGCRSIGLRAGCGRQRHGRRLGRIPHRRLYLDPVGWKHVRRE